MMAMIVGKSSPRSSASFISRKNSKASSTTFMISKS